MKLNRIQDRVRGCLAGLAIGDALGMPVEILKPEEILQVTDGKGVTGFLEPQQPKLNKKFSATAHLPAGATTDDWQLAAAIGRSLIRSGGFRLYDQAKSFVEELNRSTCGWGKTTQRAGRLLTDRLAEYNGQTRQFTHVAPPPSNRIPGAGNGVAMKIAPLALFRYLRDGYYDLEPLLSQVMELGLLTHGDPRASFCAAAIAVAIGQVLQCREDGMTSPRQIASLVIHETRSAAVILEERFSAFRPNEPLLSRILKVAYRQFGYVDRLIQRVGTGCYCLESVPFTLSVAAHRLSDFESCLLKTVNAGGDTDSNAAMAGAIVGANLGLGGIPKKWLRQVPDTEQAIELADRLTATALR